MSQSDHRLPIVCTPARTNLGGNSRRELSARDSTGKCVENCNGVIRPSSVFSASSFRCRASLFSCLLPFTKANIKVRIPVHDAYLLSMQMRNVSAEVDAKRYGNVNRVTVPAAVPSRHTGVRISSESRQPSRRKARVNSPREDPQTYSLFSSPLTVTCHPPMRSSSEIYVVNMTIGTVIAATHAIL